jgi:hypothetical protein
VSAEFQGHAGRPQAILVVNPLSQVGQRDVRPTSNEQLRSGDTAPRRTHDGHAPAPDGERTAVGHLSFNVVKLNNAKMIARMRNRVITFGSLQPISSK